MTREEEILQADCALWFWNTFHEERRMLHCNNNNSANSIAGAKMKAMGVVRGVSDMELVYDGGVLFIELKVGDNGQSEHQKDFMNKVRARGHDYVIVKSLEHFKKLVCQVIGK